MSGSEVERFVAPSASLARLAELQESAQRFNLNTREGRRDSFWDLRDRFIRLQTILNPAVCFEIGAAEATFSRHLMQTSWRGRRVAFEANPYAHAKFMADKPGRDSSLEYLNMAVTEQPGPVTFYVQKRQRGAERDPTLGDNSIMRRAVHRPADLEEVTVEGVSLEAFMAREGLEGATFSAWIDVEGANRSVLSGMASRMSQAQAIMIEVEEGEIWEGQWLAGDVCAFMDAHGMAPRARDFNYASQFNIVFVRADRADDPEVLETLRGPASR